MNRALVIGLTGAAAGLLAACGASTATTTQTPTPASTPVSTPTATSAPTATPTPAPPAVNLAGSWKGQYSGPFNGTFTLTWTQSGSTLAGTIVLSSPPNTVQITGNVGGSAITFGSVGGVAYSGTVSAPPCPAPTWSPAAREAGRGAPRSPEPCACLRRPSELVGRLP